jgi:hypothetical protein
MISIALRAVAVAAALAGAAQAQEAAVTRRATQVRDTPADSGRSVVWLPAQAPVTRGADRQGAWVQISTADGKTGWVHLFDLGPAAAQTAGGGSVAGDAMRGVTGLFRSTRSPQAPTTAGIRGLEAQDIAQAQPNPARVTQMEQLRQSEADARAFASEAELQPVVVAPLGVPARAIVSPANAPAGTPVQPQSP